MPLWRLLGCGKSYLCDKYPDKFVDVDELRLRCKYFIPEGITRDELESTKGNRKFERRFNGDDYIKELYNRLDEFVKQGKMLICSPHPENIDYLVQNYIKFAFVFQSKDIKDELIERMKNRGNPESFIKQNADMFDEFYEKNISENKSVIHYEFGKNEFLENILKKFGYKF